MVEMMYLPRDKRLVTNARNLRKNETKEEKHLWYDFLSDYPARFRRQKVIGAYIADFYCDRSKLIIEIDGGQHFEPGAMEYDEKRTAYFQSLGIKVIRFTNLDIHERFEGVCYTIDEAVKTRI
jgi:very-short-patch-repair endonuclease